MAGLAQLEGEADEGVRSFSGGKTGEGAVLAAGSGAACTALLQVRRLCSARIVFMMSQSRRGCCEADCAVVDGRWDRSVMVASMGDTRALSGRACSPVIV